MGLVEFFKSSHCWVLFSASGRGEEPSSSGGRVSGWKLAEVKPVKILISATRNPWYGGRS